MVSIVHQIDTNHEELIHDATANLSGTRLATASSDRKIKVFEPNGNKSKLLAELEGHNGPVWQLDWSHPEHGNLLASCSYDRQVIIWKEDADGHWEKVKQYAGHDSSVNSVQWAPREFGLVLACASSDGDISILRFRTEDKDWEARKITNAHGTGVNSISWAPPISSIASIFKPPSSNDKNTTSGVASGAASSGDSAAMLSRPALVERFVSGGCDHLVKIWKCEREKDEWILERTLEGHTDWVREVAWAPSIGLPKWCIATGSQDKKVIIWTNADGPYGNEWESKILNDFDAIVWHVSWSAMGNILAVSSGENRVTMWKEDLNGDFKCLSDVTT